MGYLPHSRLFFGPEGDKKSKSQKVKTGKTRREQDGAMFVPGLRHLGQLSVESKKRRKAKHNAWSRVTIFGNNSSVNVWMYLPRRVSVLSIFAHINGIRGPQMSGHRSEHCPEETFTGHVMQGLDNNPKNCLEYRVTATATTTTTTMTTLASRKAVKHARKPRRRGRGNTEGKGLLSL